MCILDPNFLKRGIVTIWSLKTPITFVNIADCYEYKGGYNGACHSDDGNPEAKFTSVLGIENQPNNADGYKVAEAYCNSQANCIGYGIHYSIDRYFFAGDEVKSLKCDNAAENKCGNGAATNGCRVKFSCGSNEPFRVTGAML